MLTLYRSFHASLVLLLFSATVLFAQQREISGVVSDDFGDPLPGAAVLLKGTSTGTVTDIDGEYRINVPNNEAVLVFSFLGYTNKEEVVGTRSTLNVSLAQAVSGLDEVVITGYGAQSRRDITGAVTSVDTDDLLAIPATTFAQQLQGRAAGVTIINDATPGGGATVRIRGFGTINNNDPLYVIDGVPTQNQGNLNPNDIESIQILKDASAASIYGSRAANGVVIITTKRGKVGKPVIAFDAFYGTQRADRGPEPLNAEELGRYLYLANTYHGRTPTHGQYSWGPNGEVSIPDYVFPSGAMTGDPGTNPALYALEPGNIYPITRSADTNWWDEVTRSAPIQSYQITASGGTENGRYALSVNYFNQEGIVRDIGYDRYSVRANTEFKALNGKLTLGENLSVTVGQRKGGFGNGVAGNNAEQNAVFSASLQHPLLPVYDIMGNFAGSRGANLGNNFNPVAVLSRAQDNRNLSLRAFGNIYGSYQITDDIEVKTSLGMDANTRRGRFIGRPQPEYVEGNFINSSTSEHEYTYQWVWSNTVSYSKTFNDVHNFDAYVGLEAIKEFGEIFGGQRQRYAFETVPVIGYLDLGDPNTATNFGRVVNDYRLYSQFGQVNYNYDGKYLVQFILRNDASSRFLQASRNATFPAFSLGWRLSDEDFIANALPFVSDMKLRYGWGKTGNQLIGDYNAYTTYRTNIFNSGYPIDGSSSTPALGFDAARFGNPNARWESTTSNNLGLDAEFLDGKFFFELDVWNRVTTDMLFQVPISYGHGDAIAPFVNIGQMTNKGLDLNLGYSETFMGGDLRLNVSANYSIYRNNVDLLDQNEDNVLFGASTRVPSVTVTQQGFPISSFFGYRNLGIFQNQEEVNAHPPYGNYNAVGKFKVEDINGDGIITDADRTIIGNPHPDFVYGINVNVGYKNWDLTLFGNGSVGNDIFNYMRYWTDFNTFQGNKSRRALYDAWTPENPGGTVPIMDSNDQISSRPSTYFIEDGTYFRLRNLQLTYNLTQNMLSKLGMSRASVYFQGQNLFTLTNYSGTNPEIQTGSNNTIGFDGGYMPVSRNLILGVNVTF
ncbi:MAG: TonB-dependent receptor [Lunatimonas sp.]|uniref:SusC/RagA family TonB-linked outer membrane protein n=1 Tax=Lunatimonas sp. TaxID=2060141 RepID=UPI00263B320C|nr:TonB-dependent receptor [Lunatimonas sp.]MCC5935821.1 TonB-dependent receptor [Lunatimonas sp.]